MEKIKEKLVKDFDLLDKVCEKFLKENKELKIDFNGHYNFDNKKVKDDIFQRTSGICDADYLFRSFNMLSRSRPILAMAALGSRA